MKVRNMTGRTGREIANQFIIDGAIIKNPKDKRKKIEGSMFQSYNSNIAFNVYGQNMTYLDEQYWEYSVTTGKNRNQFLREDKTETQAKINSGEYKLVNLN